MTNTARNANGTFARTCPTITEATTWYNDGSHMSHTSRTCPRYGQARPVTDRTMWDRDTITTSPTAWVCGHCTETAVTFEDDDVSKRGSARCRACDTMLSVTKFPTVRLDGIGQIRDTRVCRACHRNGAHVTGELPGTMVDGRYVDPAEQVFAEYRTAMRAWWAEQVFESADGPETGRMVA